MQPIDSCLILSRLDNGTLLRRAWIDSSGGKDRACLLAAIAPECGRQRSAFVCPASLMPAWLAELTPWMDDNGTLKAWPGMIRRYAAVATRWHVLSPAEWECRKWRICTHAVISAFRSAKLDTADLENLLTENPPPDKFIETLVAWAAAARAAAAAWADAAAGAAAGAARAAAGAAAAARAAAAAAGARAAAATGAAARAAAWADAAAEADAAASDALTDRILTELETACDLVENEKAS